MRKKKARWLTRAQAAAWVGARRAGRPTHPDTITRWWSRGLRGVVLQCEARGGTPYTRPAWLRRFFRALADARRPAPVDREPSPSAEARRRAKERQQLIDAGAL
jgi:hypothetical protein